MCNQHYRNIHDPSKLAIAFKSSTLLLLGRPIILETFLKNLRKGTESQISIKTISQNFQGFWAKQFVVQQNIDDSIMTA